MAFARRTTLYYTAVALAQVMFVGQSFAATSPTLAGSAPPGPGPVVFEYEIQRTTEPLSLFNSLPPPLPLGEVRRLKSERAMPAPTLAASNAPTTSTYYLPAEDERRGVGRANTALPGTPRTARQARRPPVRLREYPDTVVLVGGRPLSCRILADKGESLRVELVSGVIVHLPKRRITEVTRKASSR